MSNDDFQNKLLELQLSHCKYLWDKLVFAQHLVDHTYMRYFLIFVTTPIILFAAYITNNNNNALERELKLTEIRYVIDSIGHKNSPELNNAIKLNQDVIKQIEESLNPAKAVCILSSVLFFIGLCFFWVVNYGRVTRVKVLKEFSHIEQEFIEPSLYDSKIELLLKYEKYKRRKLLGYFSLGADFYIACFYLIIISFWFGIFIYYFFHTLLFTTIASAIINFSLLLISRERMLRKHGAD